MGIRLGIPFLPEAAYMAFLARHRQGIHSLYFSLLARPALDARLPLGPWQWDALLRGLPQLDGIPKYALLNSRFYRPEHYFDPAFLEALSDRLRVLRASGLVQGVDLRRRQPHQSPAAGALHVLGPENKRISP